MESYSADIRSVTLRRGPCFGTCPIYDVTLAADGAAIWDGERFVERLGHHHGTVDVNKFDRLARLIQRADFFSWEPEYLANVTDLPDYILTVVTDSDTKTVRQNGMDEPADFWVIAALVDGLVCAIEWTPVPGSQGTCHDWTAVHDHEPSDPSVLRVHGTCIGLHPVTWHQAGVSKGNLPPWVTADLKRGRDDLNRRSRSLDVFEVDEVDDGLPPLSAYTIADLRGAGGDMWRQMYRAAQAQGHRGVAWDGPNGVTYGIH